RTRLRLRGLEFRERTPSAEARVLHDLMDPFVRALLMLDTTFVAVLGARLLRRALDAGYAESIARNLCFEVHVCCAGIGDIQTVPDVLRRIEALLAQSDGWQDAQAVRNAFHSTRGYYLSETDPPDYDGCLAEYDLAVVLSHERHKAHAAYERALAH